MTIGISIKYFVHFSSEYFESVIVLFRLELIHGCSLVYILSLMLYFACSASVFFFSSLTVDIRLAERRRRDDSPTFPPVNDSRKERKRV